SAASPTLTDIFNKLTGVDTKVTAIKSTTDANLDAKVSTRSTQSDVTAVKSKTDALPSDPASQALTGSVKTLKFHHTFDPSAGTRGGEDYFGLLAPSSGKTYAGHITIAL